MNLNELIDIAINKDNFLQVNDYSNFCRSYLEFIIDGLQATIVSRNENNYHFFQYGRDGSFTITRPINNNLMLSANDFDYACNVFNAAIRHFRDLKEEHDIREILNKFVYTCQQSIGATLDALPAGQSNFARKLNGDLFERFIRNIICDSGIEARECTHEIPIMAEGEIQFYMRYQHDIMVMHEGNIKAIGSVKTSSKDRLDKIFIDKFMYNRLTDSNTPHFAIFLNDVQRGGREPNYRICTTFLTGHYKGYTVKLNPLDGVYYCDLRPVMSTDPFLSASIKTLDCLLVEDIWKFYL